MCGFTGFWSRAGDADGALVALMTDAIAHRGPDSEGIWVDARKEIGMGHRRLAVIDLSEAGHQPMVSACGRYVLSYNGEIYNHLALRVELEAAGAAPNWRGHSDTETLLAAIAHWGVAGTLQRLNGMFGLALWDIQHRELTLARDRMGEKPVYFGHCGKTFFFGSELKSFAPHPDWNPIIDRQALASFLRHNYVPGPASIYKGIRKLPPAHYLIVRNGAKAEEPICYWNIDQVAADGIARASGTAEELTEELDALLKDCVGLRMASDVPLGAFLSGGFDSTIVAAMMQAQSARPIRTFTIGFDERVYNEAHHAKAVAAHLGTDHTEMYVTPKDALDVVPTLPATWDEPFADSSQIPTFLLSRLTRQHVTVSLSGDGGDELFCGYNRYATGHGFWRRLAKLPPAARHVLAWSMRHTPRRAAEAMERLLPRRFGVQNISDRLPKLADVLNTKTDREYYRHLISHWRDPEAVVISDDDCADTKWLGADWDRVGHMLDRMMLADMKTYLPDDILVKVDRASMAVSLEGRIPLLDHRLVEFAWRTPLDLKIKDGQGKWLLRQVLYRYVPRKLMDRPKMGFGVPIDEWLRGPLRDWAEALLDERRLREQGFLDPAPIRQKWDEHLSGVRRWHYLLWDVLMFQAWLESR
jgi:asparagine synthase (glutamine-hydrolysing)